MDSKLSFGCGAIHFDFMEYIDCILNINNDANETGISDCSFINLNVYSNETFLILINFVGDCEGISLLNQPFTFVYKEGNYYPLKVLIDDSERNTSSCGISIRNNIITFTETVNNTMYDLLAKYIGIGYINSNITDCQSCSQISFHQHN